MSFFTQKQVLKGSLFKYLQGFNSNFLSSFMWRHTKFYQDSSLIKCSGILKMASSVHLLHLMRWEADFCSFLSVFVKQEELRVFSQLSLYKVSTECEEHLLNTLYFVTKMIGPTIP